MNRIQAFAPASQALAGPELPPLAEPSLGLFAPVRGDSPCAFFAPQHYESNYAYPLFIWLHGSGDDENHLKRVMPLVSMRNYVGASLRGTVEVETDRGRPGYSWSQSRRARGASRTAGIRRHRVGAPSVTIWLREECTWPASTLAERWPFGWP